MNELTTRQEMLLKIAIKNLENVSWIIWIDAFTEDLFYDETENELATLADDLRCDFDL